MANKKNRLLSEWVEHGPNLLKHMDTNTIALKSAKKQIKQLLDESINADEKRKIKIESKLNNFKDELGKSWKLWVRRFNQKKKDKKKSRFYVSEENLVCIQNFFSESNPVKFNTSLNYLILQLKATGINNLSDLYNVSELLSPFKEGIDKQTLSEQRNNDSQAETSIPLITKLLIKELEDNGIKNFTAIESIQKKIREANHYKKSVKDALDTKQDEIDSLKSKISNLELKIEESQSYKSQVDLLEEDNRKNEKQIQEITEEFRLYKESTVQNLKEQEEASNNKTHQRQAQPSNDLLPLNITKKTRREFHVFMKKNIKSLTERFKGKFSIQEKQTLIKYKSKVTKLEEALNKNQFPIDSYFDEQQFNLLFELATSRFNKKQLLSKLKDENIKLKEEIKKLTTTESLPEQKVSLKPVKSLRKK